MNRYGVHKTHVDNIINLSAVCLDAKPDFRLVFYSPSREAKSMMSSMSHGHDYFFKPNLPGSGIVCVTYETNEGYFLETSGLS